MYYMFLADGFEEIEALGTLDLMRRAGIDVKTVTTDGDVVCGTHGIRVFADITEKDFAYDCCDGIILPGGMPGTENLHENETVASAVSYCMDNNKLVACICAAPVILGRRGYLKGINAVCFPGFENELAEAIVKSDSLCEKDGNIITAKGAGCVFEFAYAVISLIKDSTTAKNVIDTVQYNGLK